MTGITRQAQVTCCQIKTAKSLTVNVGNCMVYVKREKKEVIPALTLELIFEIGMVYER